MSSVLPIFIIFLFVLCLCGQLGAAQNTTALVEELTEASVYNSQFTTPIVEESTESPVYNFTLGDLGGSTAPPTVNESTVGCELGNCTERLNFTGEFDLPDNSSVDSLRDEEVGSGDPLVVDYGVDLRTPFLYEYPNYSAGQNTTGEECGFMNSFGEEWGSHVVYGVVELDGLFLYNFSCVDGYEMVGEQFVECNSTYSNGTEVICRKYCLDVSEYDAVIVDSKNNTQRYLYEEQPYFHLCYGGDEFEVGSTDVLFCRDGVLYHYPDGVVVEKNSMRCYYGDYKKGDTLRSPYHVTYCNVTHAVAHTMSWNFSQVPGEGGYTFQAFGHVDYPDQYYALNFYYSCVVHPYDTRALEGNEDREFVNDGFDVATRMYEWDPYWFLGRAPEDQGVVHRKLARHESVVQCSNRYYIFDRDRAHHYIAKVMVGLRTLCSGVFVDVNVVMTAKHCMQHAGTWGQNQRNDLYVVGYRGKMRVVKKREIADRDVVELVVDAYQDVCVKKTAVVADQNVTCYVVVLVTGGYKIFNYTAMRTGNNLTVQFQGVGLASGSPVFCGFNTTHFGLSALVRTANVATYVGDLNVEKEEFERVNGTVRFLRTEDFVEVHVPVKDDKVVVFENVEYKNVTFWVHVYNSCAVLPNYHVVYHPGRRDPAWCWKHLECVNATYVMYAQQKCYVVGVNVPVTGRYEQDEVVSLCGTDWRKHRVRALREQYAPILRLGHLEWNSTCAGERGCFAGDTPAKSRLASDVIVNVQWGCSEKLEFSHSVLVNHSKLYALEDVVFVSQPTDDSFDDFQLLRGPGVADVDYVVSRGFECDYFYGVCEYEVCHKKCVDEKRIPMQHVVGLANTWCKNVTGNWLCYHCEQFGVDRECHRTIISVDYVDMSLYDWGELQLYVPGFPMAYEASMYSQVLNRKVLCDRLLYSERDECCLVSDVEVDVSFEWAQGDLLFEHLFAPDELYCVENSTFLMVNAYGGGYYVYYGVDAAERRRRKRNAKQDLSHLPYARVTAAGVKFEVDYSKCVGEDVPRFCLNMTMQDLTMLYDGGIYYGQKAGAVCPYGDDNVLTSYMCHRRTDLKTMIVFTSLFSLFVIFLLILLVYLCVRRRAYLRLKSDAVRTVALRYGCKDVSNVGIMRFLQEKRDNDTVLYAKILVDIDARMDEVRVMKKEDELIRRKAQSVNDLKIAAMRGSVVAAMKSVVGGAKLSDKMRGVKKNVDALLKAEVKPNIDCECGDQCVAGLHVEDCGCGCEGEKDFVKQLGGENMPVKRNKLTRKAFCGRGKGKQYANERLCCFRLCLFCFLCVLCVARYEFVRDVSWGSPAYDQGVQEMIDGLCEYDVASGDFSCVNGVATSYVHEPRKFHPSVGQPSVRVDSNVEECVELECSCHVEASLGQFYLMPGVVYTFDTTCGGNDGGAFMYVVGLYPKYHYQYLYTTTDWKLRHELHWSCQDGSDAIEEWKQNERAYLGEVRAEYQLPYSSVHIDENTICGGTRAQLGWWKFWGGTPTGLLSTHFWVEPKFDTYIEVFEETHEQTCVHYCLLIAEVVTCYDTCLGDGPVVMDDLHVVERVARRRVGVVHHAGVDDVRVVAGPFPDYGETVWGSLGDVQFVSFSRCDLEDDVCMRPVLKAFGGVAAGQEECGYTTVLKCVRQSVASQNNPFSNVEHTYTLIMHYDGDQPISYAEDNGFGEIIISDLVNPGIHTFRVGNTFRDVLGEFDILIGTQFNLTYVEAQDVISPTLRVDYVMSPPEPLGVTIGVDFVMNGVRAVQDLWNSTVQNVELLNCTTCVGCILGSLCYLELIYVRDTNAYSFWVNLKSLHPELYIFSDFVLLNEGVQEIEFYSFSNETEVEFDILSAGNVLVHDVSTTKVRYEHNDAFIQRFTYTDYRDIPLNVAPTGANMFIYLLLAFLGCCIVGLIVGYISYVKVMWSVYRAPEKSLKPFVGFNVEKEKVIA